MTLRALITRPEEDAAPLAAALIQRGIETSIESLLSIRTLPEAEIDLAGVQALLFTSANGVRAFAELAAAKGLAGWRDLPVLAVGDATARTARAAGFTDVESAAGNVESLAELAAAKLDPQKGPLFHGAGSAVAGDLAGILSGRGFELRRSMIYEARPADSLSPATVEALESGGFDLMLFFSPRTAATFAALTQAAGDKAVEGCRRAAALCLSPAVANVLGALPFRSMESADHPDLPSMLQLVERMAGTGSEFAESGTGEDHRRNAVGGRATAATGLGAAGEDSRALARHRGGCGDISGHRCGNRQRLAAARSGDNIGRCQRGSRGTAVGGREILGRSHGAPECCRRCEHRGKGRADKAGRRSRDAAHGHDQPGDGHRR